MKNLENIDLQKDAVPTEIYGKTKKRTVSQFKKGYPVQHYKTIISLELSPLMFF